MTATVKNLLSFSASLDEAINSTSSTMVLSEAATTSLKAHLGTEDYTYLVLSNGVDREVVEVSIESDEIVIVRGLDGTTASAFPKGSCVRFMITDSWLQAKVCSLPEDCIPTPNVDECSDCSSC